MGAGAVGGGGGGGAPRGAWDEVGPIPENEHPCVPSPLCSVSEALPPLSGEACEA